MRTEVKEYDGGVCHVYYFTGDEIDEANEKSEMGGEEGGRDGTFDTER